MNRRDLILGTGAVALSVAASKPGKPPRTRLILLGTAGGPRPRKTRAAPSQAIIVDDSTYVIDCGNGVARQLTLADVPLRSLRHVLVTHHHSDHNADYGNLLLLAWAAGLQSPVDCWGPPPLGRMTEQYLALNAMDIELRTRDEGRVPIAPLLRPHEVAAPGMLYQDSQVGITAALVDHPPLPLAFAYRFDMADRSIVISGDTRRSENLIALARGADVLVHEAMYPEAIDRLVAPVANARSLKQSILSHHTAVEEVGRVAQQAGKDPGPLPLRPGGGSRAHRQPVAGGGPASLYRSSHRGSRSPGNLTISDESPCLRPLVRQRWRWFSSRRVFQSRWHPLVPGPASLGLPPLRYHRLPAAGYHDR